MDYRGSKIIAFNVIVKEQRVDDSYRICLIRLRCTLKNFERNYQIRFKGNK
jgi:hypothetical protein